MAGGKACEALEDQSRGTDCFALLDADWRTVPGMLC